MERIRLYLQESYHELVKEVTWPTWQTLYSTTLLVLMSIVIISLLVAGMSLVSDFITTKTLYKL